MTLTIGTLEKYLGNPASVLLSDEPFKHWVFERSVDDDLDELRINYEFPDDGMDFLCDPKECVDTIFLYFDQERYFKEGLLDIPLSLTRQQLIDRFGSPSKSGSRRSHPILGERGAWDRFARPAYSIHIEYRIGVDRINGITLMRADVVP